MTNKTKKDRNGWFRYAINHNSGGEPRWFYLFGPEWWAADATEEHFALNMPDSHKWRGAKFEKVPANKVPRKVRAKRDADYRHRSLCAAASDMYEALRHMIDSSNLSCRDKALDALAKAEAEPGNLNWHNLY